MKAAQYQKGPISWMARNPVAANLVMLALVIGGIVMLSFNMRREVFPRTELDMVAVTVPYPGASPEEVEQGIVMAIEEAVRSIDGVKEVRGRAQEGVGTVRIDLEVGVDKNKTLADVKSEIDRITTFPQDAERPIVMAPEFKIEAIWMVLYGDISEKVLFEIGEQVRDKLLAHSEISYVEVEGVRPLEIAVELGQENLRKYNLTLPGVADTIRRTALDLPAGAVKTNAGEVMLRTAERRDLGEEFADIPLFVDDNGSSVKLGEVATINDGFSEADLYAKFNGKPCIIIKAFSVGDEDPTEVATAVKEMTADLKESLPPGVSAATWLDMSDLYQQRLDLMVRNAGIGLILVLVILGLFLEPRLAFWVTMGIPISFLGSFLFLPAMGISLNMISMFAFIVTLGMVVDDAIVVGENAFRFRREGMPTLKAAIKGAKQMGTPVFFSIATSIAAFAPLLFVPGMRGKIMMNIPAVVIIVLAISLLESFFVLPAHLAHVSKEEALPRLKAWIVRPLFSGNQTGIIWAVDRFLTIVLLPLNFLSRLLMVFALPLFYIQAPFSRMVERFIQNYYRPLARVAVRQRWITLSVGVAILFTSCGVMFGGHVKQIDFPKEESDWVFVNASLPYGAPVEETMALTDRLIDSARAVMEENGGQQIGKGIYSLVGNAQIRGDRVTGTHVTTVGAILVPTIDRDIGSNEFAKQWREKLGEVPGLETLKFDATTGHGETPPIDLKLSHRDPEMLEAAAVDLASYINTIKGVIDIDDGIELGKPQLDFKMSPEGTAVGLTSIDLASQVRGSFYGSEAIRQQRGRNELRVMVKLPRNERESLSSVEDMIIRTPTGGEIPLRVAASVKHGRAYTTIKRTDGKRTIGVKAEVVEADANAEEVTDNLFRDYLPTLKAKFPGIELERGGRQKDMQEFMSFMLTAYILTLLIMYTLIAIPLKSYLQPLFVVMMAIPFGFVGALFGHMVIGIDISMISWMGIVALSGVVVNDSLVFVDAANRFKKKGLSALQAGEEAAVQRFRPIVLTSLTTFGGLMPMILETSVQARILIPMAVSLGFGILFSTFIVLLLVPALFVMIETPRDWWRERSAGHANEMILDDDAPDPIVTNAGGQQ